MNGVFVGVGSFFAARIKSCTLFQAGFTQNAPFVYDSVQVNGVVASLQITRAALK